MANSRIDGEECLMKPWQNTDILPVHSGDEKDFLALDVAPEIELRGDSSLSSCLSLGASTHALRNNEKREEEERKRDRKIDAFDSSRDCW